MSVVNETFLFFHLSSKRQRFLDTVIPVHAPETRRTKILGLCKTRWVERHTALESFEELYECLAVTFEAILHPQNHPEIPQVDTWNWDTETTTKTRGLLASMMNFQNIVSFLVLMNCLHPLSGLASKLQKRDQDILNAYNNIDDVAADIQGIRDKVEKEYDVWYEASKTLAEVVRSIESAPRVVCGRQTLRSNVPAVSPKQYYLRSIEIPLIDALREQLETRFSRDDTLPTSALLQLVPRILCTKSTDGLVDKLLFYEDDLTRPTSLQSEVNSWQRKWSSVQQDARPDSFAEAYPYIRKLMIIRCTLPEGSCEAERSFSFFRSIKTCLRNKWEKLSSPHYH